MTPEELTAILLTLSALMMLLPLFATWIIAVALGNYTSVRNRLKAANLPHDFKTITGEYMPKVHRWFAIKFLLAGVLLLADSVMLYIGNQPIISLAILIGGLLILLAGLKAIGVVKHYAKERR